MKLTFAAAQDEHKIKRLLALSDLHHQDIGSSHLKHFLLAWNEADLIGVIGLEITDQYALLRSLAVSADYRNKGIGSWLVGEIENHATSLKLKTLYLLTMTAESFFAKHGYQRTSRESTPDSIQNTAEFANICPASAACMFKHLKEK